MSPHAEPPVDFAWHPSEALLRESNVARFMARHGIPDIASLRRRSVEDIRWFWQAVLDDLDLKWERPYDSLLDPDSGFEWARWFVGGRINLTVNVLDRHLADGHGDDVALSYEADSDAVADRRQVTYAELASLVNQAANAMQSLGIGPGDHVGLYAPMRIETIVVFLATIRIGARIVPVFCGYGTDALAERLSAAGCKALFSARELRRRGKATNVTPQATAAAKASPTVQHVIWTEGEDWLRFLADADNAHTAHSTAAEDPCLVIYTSGTTGRPKGTVHTHAGCLAQMGKELRYAFDVRPRDVFFWFTDMGWMMGPWEIVGVLQQRGTVVLFDGAPDWPDPGRLWSIIRHHNVRTFGISPTAIRLLMLAGTEYPARNPMPSLELLGSTGEPWDAASWRWFFDHVGGGTCPILNISGGTEIVGCLLQPYPVEPIKPCSLGGPALGMDCDIVDEEGRPVEGTAIGHLVCRQPGPSMTKGFLNDPQRYLDTYFARFPGVWYHGDWAHRDADGCWFLHGRSDDTIKVAGKRVGPSEIEAALIAHPAISEAATIGVPDSLKGQALVCFVVPNDPAEHPAEVDLVAHVAAHMGKPLAPRRVLVVAALPKTRSGKIVRGTIARAYLGEDTGDASSLANPEALEAIRALGGR